MLKKLSFLLFVITFATTANAQYKWQGASNGLWTTASNWFDVSTSATAAFAPQNATDIIFDAPANISVSGSVACNSIKVTNNATVVISASGGTSSAQITLTLRSSSNTVKALQVDAGATFDIKSISVGTTVGYFYLRPFSNSFILINGTIIFSGNGTPSNSKFDWVNNAAGSPIAVTVNGTYIHDTFAGTYLSPAAPSSITFNAGSIFDSRRSGGMIIPTANFDSLSTIKVSGIVGTGSQSWGGLVYTYGNFEYTNPTQSGTINLSLPTNAIFKGYFKLLGSNTQKIRLNSSPNNITVKGNFEVASTTVSIANSTTTNTVALSIFGNLVESGTSIIDLQETVSSTAGNTLVKLKGNIVQDATSIIKSSPTTSTAGTFIELNGTTNQNITINGGITNVAASPITLKMNNAAGATILTDVNIPQLDLTLGNITTGAKTLTITTPNTTLATLKGGTVTSHIVGNLARITGTTGTYLFPIGTGNSVRSVKLAPTSTIASTFLAKWVNGAPPTGTLPAGIDHISPSESWDISRTSGTANVFMTLTTDNGVTVPAELSVLHYDSAAGAWEDLGNDGAASGGAGLSSNVTSSFAASSFSPFTIGATAAPNNPLPVDLVRFEANVVKNTVALNWEVANEKNVAKYDVQFSTDAKTFKTISNVTANASRQYSFAHNAPVSGQNYYRLNVIDRDGKTKKSDIVNATLQLTTAKVYPTVATDAIQISFDDANNETYEIVNAAGAIVMTGSISTQPIQVSQLAKGIYFVKIKSQSTLSFIKE